MNGNKAVMLALSGGVDSSVCAARLKDMGYNIRAVVMQMSNAHGKTLEAAKKSAHELDIPLTILDLRRDFKKKIIDTFISDYNNARTPNPCVICNPYIKFRALLAEADRQDCDFISTGHYARVSSDCGRFFIRTAACAEKDQSYMLYRLSQNVLSRLILPLGDITKNEVRQIAAQLGLFCADTPDSQENCFITDGDYGAYIEAHCGPCKKGNFISPEGKAIGEHRGIIHYTVGQRKGLGIALGQPVFITRIDGVTGDIFLSYAGSQMKSEIEVRDCVYMLKESLTAPETAEVKIRSAARPQAAHITPQGGGYVSVKFESPVSAPAPGQSAVFYKDGRVLGGGFIV